MSQGLVSTVQQHVLQQWKRCVSASGMKVASSHMWLLSLEMWLVGLRNWMLNSINRKYEFTCSYHVGQCRYMFYLPASQDRLDYIAVTTPKYQWLKAIRFYSSFPPHIHHMSSGNSVSRLFILGPSWMLLVIVTEGKEEWSGGSCTGNQMNAGPRSDTYHLHSQFTGHH